MQANPGIIHKEDKQYFVAVYADRAILKACVNCHNTHILGPKRGQKIGDGRIDNGPDYFFPRRIEAGTLVFLIK